MDKVDKVQKQLALQLQMMADLETRARCSVCSRPLRAHMPEQIKECWEKLQLWIAQTSSQPPFDPRD